MESQATYSLGGIDLSSTGYLQDAPMFGQEFDGFNWDNTLDGFNWDNTDAIPVRSAGRSACTGVEELLPHSENAPQELVVVEPPVANAGFTQQAPYPAGDAGGLSAATGMEMEILPLENGPAEVNSLQKTTSLIQVDPYSAGIDFSTATDKEIIGHFRAWLERREESTGQNNDPPEAEDAIARLDPWEIPRHGRLGWGIYFATRMWGSDEKTRSQGYWKEDDNNKLAVVSNRRAFSSESRFVGLKRRLEFHKNDGTKTNWVMNEYVTLSQSDGDIFVEESKVLRFVDINHTSDRVIIPIPAVNINGEHEDEQNRNNISGCHCLHHATAQNNQPPSGKGPRTDGHPKIGESDVWKHFTRIYARVPKKTAGSSKKKTDRNLVSKKKTDKKLVYVVCNYCEVLFDADSRQGTSHHRRHAEACRCKHSQPNR